MFDRRYFVYMLQSVSRRALYMGFTNFLIGRVIEHRIRKYPNSFSARYRTWRLVCYEEFGDAEAAHERERQLKGWSRAKKEALIVKMNPRWRDLIAEWEEKYGLEFRLDGRIEAKLASGAKGNSNSNDNRKGNGKTKDPSTPVSRAEESAREPPPLRMVEFIRGGLSFASRLRAAMSHPLALSVSGRFVRCRTSHGRANQWRQLQVRPALALSCAIAVEAGMLLILS